MNQLPQSKQQPDLGTLRMSPAMVQHLVIYLLGNIKVQNEAVKALEPRHFSLEPHFQLLWKVVLDQVLLFGTGNVKYDAMYFALEEELSQTALVIVPMQRALLLAGPTDVGQSLVAGHPESGHIEQPGLLYHIFHTEDRNQLDGDVGLGLLKRFLNERAVVDAARQMVVGTETRLPGDFEKAVDELRSKLVRVKTIGNKIWEDFSQFPDDPQPLTIEPTGVSHLDAMMGGGHVGGEVYLYLGPQKHGKSFQSLQIAASCGARYATEVKSGGKPRFAYYFSYELSKKEVRHRLASFTANILLDRLMHEIQTNADYSTRGNILPYETAMYRAKGMHDFDNLPGERERYQAFNQTFGQYIISADMRGESIGNVDGTVGTGGIGEIVDHLQQMTSEGRPPGVVIIDYTNRVVEAHLTATGANVPKEYRLGIIQFVRAMFRRVAVPFNVPVWLVQQYNVEGNHTLPTKRLHAGMSAEARTIGADISMAFCQGTVDPGSKVAQLVLDLTRRTGNQQETRLIQLQGEWSRWVDVTGNYELVTSGEGSGSIVEKGKAATTQVSASAAQKLAKKSQSVDPYKIKGTDEPA